MIPSLYDKFKDWSKTGSVYILSDTHFDDSDCKLMNPSWITPQEHIDIINKTVFKSDLLIHLGDVGDPTWLSKIKCRNRILIKGNHDAGNAKYEKYFSEIYEGPLFISDKILLSHEPIFGLPFCINIHGHCHNGEYSYNDEFGGKHINLASDVTNFTLFNLGAEIKKGLVSGIDSIHRITIDKATLNPIHKNNFKMPIKFNNKEELYEFLQNFNYADFQSTPLSSTIFMVRYECDGKIIEEPTYFSPFEDVFFASPCEIYKTEMPDDEIFDFVISLYEEDDLSSALEYEKTLQRNGIHYDIDFPQVTPYLPDEIVITDVFSEEKLIDYFLEKEKNDLEK